MVICHAVESDYYYVRTGAAPATDFQWFFGNILFTIGRLGVPLFLMITGALMLDREYDLKTYYKHSVLPLLLTTEIWIVINYFFNCYRYSLSPSIKELLGNILFIKPSPINHMWYMPMILGMYLVIPFVAKALKGVCFSSVLLPLIIGFTAFSLVPLYNSVANGYLFLPAVQLFLGTGFLGGLYGVIMVIGHYIANQKVFKKIPLVMLMVILVTVFVVNTVLARHFFNKGLYQVDAFSWYTSPFIITVAVCFFEILRRLPIKNSKVVRTVARSSFGIYLTHNLVLIFANSKLKKIPEFTQAGVVPQTTIRFALAFFIPIVFMWLIDKLPLPRIKKIFLFLK